MYCLVIFSMLSGIYQLNNKRVLELYTYPAGNSAYRKQLAILAANKEGLHGRDLIVKKNIHRKPGVAGGYFTVVLIGKDGGEKYRSDQPVTAEKLFAIIDAMPMRKEEMRKPSKQ